MPTKPTIAPDIFRQRLLLEGFFTRKITKDEVRDYLVGSPGTELEFAL